MTHLICHKRWNWPTDLVVPARAYCRPHHDEKKSCWNWDLCQVAEDYTFLKPNECSDWFGQEIYLANQNIGCFRVNWQLLHESIQLKKTSNEMTSYLFMKFLLHIWSSFRQSTRTISDFQNDFQQQTVELIVKNQSLKDLVKFCSTWIFQRLCIATIKKKPFRWHPLCFGCVLDTQDDQERTLIVKMELSERKQ